MKKIIINPLNSQDTCTLHNTKKSNLYTHTYDPTIYIQQLRSLGMSTEILDKFDHKRNDNCCKVIAISLYFPACQTENMEKYLFSIYRTVKNVEKNLNDWVVRLYFDMSVYRCVLDLDETADQKSDTLIARSIDEIDRIFEIIIGSPNVELYTYECRDTSIPLEKTRTLRYLPLSDPEVALCVVREADGFVSNLDCHNLKLYDRSDKLFYLPQLVKSDLFIYDRDSKEYDFSRYVSYSEWLKQYKKMIEREYFLNHQNLYDLLAGLFAIKLRFNQQAYLECSHNLTMKINTLLSDVKTRQYDKHNMDKHTISYDLEKSENVCDKRTTDNKYEHYVSWNTCIFNLADMVDFDRLKTVLDVGFDEILLLDFLKEIISITLPYNETILKTTVDIKIYDDKAKLFFQRNISKIIIPLNIKDFNTVGQKLIEKKIILRVDGDLIGRINTFLASNIGDDVDKNPQTILCMVDTLLTNIITDSPFEISYKGRPMTELLNMPYKLSYDAFYDSV